MEETNLVSTQARRNSNQDHERQIARCVHASLDAQHRDGEYLQHVHLLEPRPPSRIAIASPALHRAIVRTILLEGDAASNPLTAHCRLPTTLCGASSAAAGAGSDKGVDRGGATKGGRAASCSEILQ
jgi:hypothetical protein